MQINWQAVAGTLVLIIGGVCELLLNSTDPALSGWSRLAVQAVAAADTIVALQIHPAGYFTPLALLRPKVSAPPAAPVPVNSAPGPA